MRAAMLALRTTAVQPRRRCRRPPYGRAAAGGERPIGNAIGMNAGYNVFGSGNRANATIGRAIRLMLLTVAAATPGDLDKSDARPSRQIRYCIAENEERARSRPTTSSRVTSPEDIPRCS